MSVLPPKPKKKLSPCCRPTTNTSHIHLTLSSGLLAMFIVFHSHQRGGDRLCFCQPTSVVPPNAVALH